MTSFEALLILISIVVIFVLLFAWSAKYNPDHNYTREKPYPKTPKPPIRKITREREKLYCSNCARTQCPNCQGEGWIEK